MTLAVLDLFSCLGGHALGLRAAGGFRTVQFVELDPFRRRVLRHHFPAVPIHDDVRTYVGAPGEADVIVGGPPCQQTSVAAAVHGRRTGASLWTHMGRIVGSVRPSWVVVEQPPGNAAWEAEVAADLEELGYGVSRVVLSAWDFGAPHLRRRVFALAHRDLSRLQVARQAGSRAVGRLAGGAADGNPWRAGVPRALRVADGVPGRGGPTCPNSGAGRLQPAHHAPGHRSDDRRRRGHRPAGPTRGPTPPLRRP